MLLYNVGIQLFRPLVMKYALDHRIQATTVRVRYAPDKSMIQRLRASTATGGDDALLVRRPPGVAGVTLRSVLASIAFTIASASASRPFAINQRGDSGSPRIRRAMRRPGTPPMSNMTCQ